MDAVAVASYSRSAAIAHRNDQAPVHSVVTPSCLFLEAGCLLRAPSISIRRIKVIRRATRSEARTFVKTFALWLTVWRSGWRSRVRKSFQRALPNALVSEALDFDINVIPPVLPKRPANSGEPYSLTQKVWRKIVYWAKCHDSMTRATFPDVQELEPRLEKVAVLGGGAFGTAMGAHLAAKGHAVRLVLRDEDVRDYINTRHVNPRYLSEFELPDTLCATIDAAEALEGCTAVVHAVPVQVSRKFLEKVKAHLPHGVPIIAVSKGMEIGTGNLMCDLIPEALGRTGAENPVVVVSGPSFAKEILDKRPTSVMAASRNPAAALRVQRLLSSCYFRVSMTDDLVGVEVAGAFKNVLAIAAGICEGLGLGLNAMSALVTQGTAEIRWLATAMGARPETLAGLAGMGDILLTCFGSLSRNRCLGVRLGQGEPLEEILNSSGGVTEGVYTSRLVVELGDKYRVLMPVLTSVARILSGEVSPRQAVYEVMSLPTLPESA